MGDAENLSKATVCLTVRAVCMALKSMVLIFITFPGHRGLCHIKEDFSQIAGNRRCT